MDFFSRVQVEAHRTDISPYKNHSMHERRTVNSSEVIMKDWKRRGDDSRGEEKQVWNTSSGQLVH